jgi:glycosyltransferase involved in cell wall biosynthesis
MLEIKNMSIVILTYNSQRTLERCLEAVSKLEYPDRNIEVLMLDNGSQDNTLEIIKQYGYNYKVLPEYNLSRLRNFGADASNGEIIAFIDSDCIVSADWAMQVNKWFNDPSVGIVGNEYILPENATKFERNWYANYNFGVNEKELIPAGNMAIRKAYFEQLGGFDNRLSTGEDDYILGVFRRAGYKTISDHKVRSIHLGNAKNLCQYFRKEKWYGLGMLGTLHMTKLDKPLIATLIFMTSVLVSIFCLLTFCLYDFKIFVLLASYSALIAFAVILFSALDRVFRKRRKGNLAYVMIVFIVFFLARFSSLVKQMSTVSKKRGSQL